MIRKLLVQILTGEGYYDDSSSNNVTLYYLGADGAIDTTIGTNGEVGALTHISHGVWEIELDSDDLAEGRTDWYQVQYGSSSILTGYERYYFPTVALTPSDITALRALIDSADTPVIPADDQSVFDISDSNVGVDITITTGWDLGVSDMYKVYYEIDTAPDDPDTTSRFVIGRRNPISIPIGVDEDGLDIKCSVVKVNALGVESEIPSVGHTPAGPHTIDKEFTIEALAQEMASGQADVLAGKIAEKDDFASAVSGKL